MSTHNHHWVYLCDALLAYTEKDLQSVDPDLRRLEFCMHCGTIRVHLGGHRWAVVESTLTKDFMKNFEKTTSQVVKNPPEEFVFRPAKAVGKRRLGRGLEDLIKESSVPNRLKLLISKKDS